MAKDCRAGVGEAERMPPNQDERPRESMFPPPPALGTFSRPLKELVRARLGCQTGAELLRLPLTTFGARKELVGGGEVW